MSLRRIILLTALMLSLPALAQTTEITSDRFVVAEGKQQATFSGNVVVKQPNLTVHANEVVVFYGEGGATDLKELEAQGNVRIETPDQNVTGNLARYDPKSRILRVTGNVVVINSAGRVTGPELLVNLETGTSEFVRSGGRVTGVFTPQGD